MTELEFIAMLGGEDSVGFSFLKVKELYDRHEALVVASRTVLDWAFSRLDGGVVGENHPLQILCEALI